VYRFCQSKGEAVSQANIVEQFRVQAGWCARLGSPFSAALLERAAADVRAGGPCAAVLEGHEADRPGTLLPLRFLGALHRLVLRGWAPALAGAYPSVGGDGNLERAWPAFREVFAAQREELCGLLNRPVQTNEVGRAAALLGGFLRVAETTGLPLRLLEVGASAGLNLRWDRYRYETSNARWGDPASPVCLASAFADRHPRFDVPVRVAERRGCDIAPLDPRSAEDRLTLRSYVWPDQRERYRLLDAALAVAQGVPAPVEPSDAAPWLAAHLAEARPGVATVVFHSIVWPYLDETERAQVPAVLAAAGGRATADAPLAWLRMEPGGEQAEVRLARWPGGEGRLLATSGFHGRDIHWLAE
jgi:hypothetical protein